MAGAALQPAGNAERWADNAVAVCPLSVVKVTWTVCELPVIAAIWPLGVAAPTTLLWAVAAYLTETEPVLLVPALLV